MTDLLRLPNLAFVLKHGQFGKAEWGEWVHIGLPDHRQPMIWDVQLGASLSTLEADLEAGTF